ncbi:hypothetical protein EMQ25_14685 [Arsenicitalea aurantiaca]|uniref:PepSY domain-containing protein n=1 Tax=Arsenicitalea aurantiaca TaxID=1783274 RepID=A0A433X5M4_9HYPH|nr:hypothetical protein [Arsenicitalea aurantiaca]RUT29363.1 hypothetical protein EMQ25_14685 [Arsenicitalea aurantiaca]
MKTALRTLLLIGSLILAGAFAGTPAFAQALQAEQQEERMAPLPITAAMAAATGRFAGRIIGAELVAGRPEEMTDMVYAFRMLTDGGDILAIRVDARDGTILEVDGRGLVAARRRP